MKLIVHMGLHKTASTYFQHALNDNHAALAKAGVFYAPQAGYPAHHSTAWRLLSGDPDSLIDMIDFARGGGCRTVILSSEDLEGALFDQRPIDAIHKAARLCDVQSVEWHAVLRDPGECFASLFHQLQHHVYADALSLFHDVMRRGFVHIAEPVPGDGTPYWYYAFEHQRDLSRLATRTGDRVVAHDYNDNAPFPGWRILDAIDGLDCIDRLPGAQARNARLDPETVIQGYAERMADAVPGEAHQQAIVSEFTTALRNSMDGLDAFARIVGETHAQSHAQALTEFGSGNQAQTNAAQTPATALAKS